MKRTYYCPKCNATLNPNVKIILVAKKRQRRGMVLFSPNPGNYKAVVAEDLNIQNGDKVSFFCPICQADLLSSIDKNLAEISFKQSNGTEGKVNFSRIFGEEATFFVTREQVRSFGSNAEIYGAINFFGEGLDDD